MTTAILPRQARIASACFGGKLTAALALALFMGTGAGSVYAQIVAYPGGTNDTSAGGVAPSSTTTGVTATNLLRGPGLMASSGSGSTEASTDGRTTTSTFATSVTASPGKYYTFTITPAANFAMSFSSITAGGTASGTGPSNAQWGYSLNNFSAGLGTASTLTTGTVATTAALTDTGVTSSVEFRFVGFRPGSAGGSGGTFRITAPSLTGTAALRSASTLVWDGGQGNGNWNSYTGTAANQSNWNLNNIPATGLVDALQFAGTTQATTTNNITGLTVSAITFASGAGAFTNGGSSVTLNGGVTNSSTNLQKINHPLALSSGAHTIAATSGDLTFGGAISGAGSLTKTGVKTLNLTVANNYTGPTVVSAGILSAAAITGSALGGTASVSVERGGTLQLGNNNQIKAGAAVNLGGGTGTGTATFDTHGFNEGTSVGGALGALTISGDSTLALGGAGSETIHFSLLGTDLSTLGDHLITIENWGGTIGSTGGASRILFDDLGVNNEGVHSQFQFDIGGVFYDGALSPVAGGYELYAAAAVPEPTTTLLGLVTILGLAGYRRRRPAR